MIAVPTNNLKSELVQKIGRDKVLEIPSFEDLPLPPELRQTIEKNYSMGFINDALESIKTYAHNSKDNSIFMNYLHPETALAHSSKYVIMTHARFLTLPNRVLKNFEVLIDEDILYTMLTRTGSVQISSLKKALKANVFSPEKQIEIEELLKLKDNKSAIRFSLLIVLSARYFKLIDLLKRRFSQIGKHCRKPCFSSCFAVCQNGKAVLSYLVPKCLLYFFRLFSGEDSVKIHAQTTAAAGFFKRRKCLI